MSSQSCVTQNDYGERNILLQARAVADKFCGEKVFIDSIDPTAEPVERSVAVGIVTNRFSVRHFLDP